LFETSSSGAGPLFLRIQLNPVAVDPSIQKALDKHIAGRLLIALPTCGEPNGTTKMHAFLQ
jgi:hypothetical protein